MPFLIHGRGVKKNYWQNGGVIKWIRWSIAVPFKSSDTNENILKIYPALMTCNYSKLYKIVNLGSHISQIVTIRHR